MSAIEAQQLAYKVKFANIHYEVFQSWLEDLIRALHPAGDFQRIRKTQGDGGLDGFVISSQVAYAIYAPSRRKEDRDSETAAKIRSDFATAFTTLKGNLKAWVFVHNHPEARLGKLGIKAVSDLKAANPSIKIAVLDIDGLWEKLKELPHETRNRLFGEHGTSDVTAREQAPEEIPANLKKLLVRARDQKAKQRYHKARPLYEEALQIAAEKLLPQAYVEALEPLIEILDARGELNERKLRLEQGIKWFEPILSQGGGDARVAFVASRIAFLYESLDNIHLALNYWNMAALKFDSLGNARDWIQCRAGAARCRGRLGNSTEALAIWQDIRKRFEGHPDPYLTASVANNYGMVCGILCRFPEAKVCFDEAEVLANKFGYKDILFMVRHNRDRLQQLRSAQAVPEVGFRELVEELYYLFDWFPEAKREFLPFWFECRIAELQSAIRTMPGLKFILFQDDLERFSATASALHAYGNLFAQVLQTPFEAPSLSFDDYVEIPYPPDKPLYPCVDTEYLKRGPDGLVLSIPNDGRLQSSYWLTPNRTISKSTGNEGLLVAGFPNHLPKETFEFFYNRSAQDLLEKRQFFLPLSRGSLSSDLTIAWELDLIPVFYRELPRSEHVEGFLSARTKLPIKCSDFPEVPMDHITPLRQSLVRLASVSVNHARAEFAEVLSKAEALTTSCASQKVIEFQILVLRLLYPTDQELRVALVIHDQ